LMSLSVRVTVLCRKLTTTFLASLPFLTVGSLPETPLEAEVRLEIQLLRLVHSDVTYLSTEMTLPFVSGVDAPVTGAAAPITAASTAIATRTRIRCVDHTLSGANHTPTIATCQARPDMPMSRRRTRTERATERSPNRHRGAHIAAHHAHAEPVLKRCGSSATSKLT